MKNVEFWFWRMADEFGRRRKSVCRFTEAEAWKRDPNAERIEGSCEVRNCPETLDENYSIAPARGWSTRGVG